MSVTETAGQGPESIDLGGSVRIAELLQVCHLTQKTGVVDVFNESRAGRLYLDRGEVIHAQFGDDAGLGAAIEVLLLDRAQASFTPDVTTFRRTIQVGLADILHAASERGARVPKGFAHKAGEDKADAEEEAERFPVLEVLFGGEMIHFRLEKQEMTLGRSAGNDIVIQNDSISRRHVIFEIREDFVLLHDLNSSNGTFLCGHRVADAVLAPGDKIVFGDVPAEFTWKVLVEIKPPPELKVVPRRGRYETHILPGVPHEEDSAATVPLQAKVQVG